MPKPRRDNGEPRATDFVESLDRGLRLLQAFGERPAPMSLSEIAKAAELPRAAAAYVLNGANDEAPYIWPWAKSWWKPRDARANYVRAAALLLAEIERIDRAQEGGAS